MNNVIGSPSGAGTTCPAAVASIRERFEAVNSARIERVRASLRPSQRIFPELLPLLFDVNHPKLPGYVSDITPAGIPGFRPHEQTLESARQLVEDFRYSQPVGDAPVWAIYLIGSPGTIAYSEESDFDIWLCHDPALPDEAVEQLQQKANGVERWAEELGLEVHIFLINTETFRSETKAVSSESSGSAQLHLLLEEFYRTGVRVGGRYPLWWLVPPEREADYDSCAAELKTDAGLAEEALDFGGLAPIPAEEFFGAAVWQLSKGIDSPYKAALKLLLFESYASEYPHIHLLSLRFKELVYAGERNIDRLDPYLMMLDKVEEYLFERNEPERLELARRCFYFKVNDRLSRHRQDGADWRRELLRNRISSWGWTREDLAVMDSRDQWNVQRVGEERRTLFEAHAASYRFLSDFARRYAGMAMISQRDLTILGRKLYSAYVRKAGKIELLNRGIATSLCESHLALEEVFDEAGQPIWLLYAGPAPSESSENRPLKRARSPVELATWCHLNGLTDHATVVNVRQHGSGLTAKDFRLLIKHLEGTLPVQYLGSGAIDEFARPARIDHAAVFVNIGVKSRDRELLAKEAGKSGGSDALSFGCDKDTLLISIDLVLATSWREVIAHRYSGPKGMLDCLRDYLKWSPPSAGQMPPVLKAFGLSAYKGLTVGHRLEQLFNDVISCYYAGKNPLETRYVLAVGNGYFVLQFEEGGLHHQSLPDLPGLIGYLGRPQRTFSPVVIDRHALAQTVLPVIYAHNKPGLVQLFYRPNGAEVEIFILDERGSLFYQRGNFFSSATLLNQYSRFFEAVLNRMNFLMQDGETVAAADGVEFFSIGNDSAGNLLLDRKAPDFGLSESQYFSLQVMADMDEAGRTVFTLYCNDREFSTLEYGDDLFNAVARHVLEQRRSSKGYPIFITDISLARAVIGDQGSDRMQTVQFLHYKQAIEDRLNRSLEHG